jgi:hypothetical protein
MLASMGLRASTLVCFAALGCAKGGLPDATAGTFGVSSAASTNAMTSSDPSDAQTDSSGSGTQGTGPSSVSASAEADATAGSSAEVGGEDCGNGMVDGAEQCDGAELGGNDCVSAGFVGGAVACTAACTLDTSDCVDAACGDAVLQDGEACDCGGAACTSGQLGNQTCAGLGHAGGELGCTAACEFDASACFACGDGVLNPGEACDGADLAGQSCVSQGFDAGALSCSATCTFSTVACIDYVCGNGSCDPGEDSCSCVGDCPDDPNSCANPCECGGLGGACFCDQACLDFGDCCANGPC